MSSMNMLLNAAASLMKTCQWEINICYQIPLHTHIHCQSFNLASPHHTLKLAREGNKITFGFYDRGEPAVSYT